MNAKGVRKDVYDHPYIYEILSDGSKRLIGRKSDRKLSVLSMFGVGSVDANGKRTTLFGRIRQLGGAGVGLSLGMLFLLLGSVIAIIAG